MLNLQVAMIRELFSLIITSFLLMPISAIVPSVEISSPQEGQVLKGSVQIIGTISSDGFVSGDVSYAYDSGDDTSWFYIASISKPVANETIAVWDTSTISDGDYQIKVSVKYSDGQVKEVILHQLQVRNYSSVQSTPDLANVSAQATVFTETVTPKPEVIATPFPTNSGSLETSHVEDSLKTGAIIGIVLVILLGIYTFFRWLKYFR
jgi:hypothetical protein